MWPEIVLDKGVLNVRSGTYNSEAQPVHRTIYGHMHLWPEIVLNEGVLNGRSGTYIRRLKP